MKCTWPFIAVLLVLLTDQLYARVSDPYHVLGVSKGASEDELKRAYRKLALKYHPDKNRNNKKATARFLEIQEAYDILTTPEKRQAHDSGWGEGSSSGAGSRYHRQHQRWSHYQQGSWRFEWPHEDSSYDAVIPSATTMITSSNIANNVLYSLIPWLILVYAEDSPASRKFARVWEDLAKVAASSKESSPQQTAWFSMGRINWRHQRQLAYWVANSRVSGGDFTWSSLPIVYAVRPECAQSECFIRYRGPMTMTGLQDFVASRLLDWQPIPAVDLHSLDIMLSRVHPAKVVALAFTKSEGQGSLQLRHLAEEQADMMAFARVQLASPQASGMGTPGDPDDLTSSSSGSTGSTERLLEQWSWKLGVTGLKPNTLVLLRGPGTTPQVLHVRAAELESTINEQTLMWQVIPALRPNTVGPLGCRWGAPPAGSAAFFMGDSVSSAKLCVLVMGHNRRELNTARTNLLHLNHFLHHTHLHAPHLKTQLQGLAGGVSQGQVRLTWLDTSAQPDFCRHHFERYDGDDGSRPDSEAGGGHGDARQQQQRLAAAVCGRSWQELWSSDIPAAAQAVTQGRLRQAFRQLRQPPVQVALLAYRPTPPGSHRQGHHLFSLLTDVDLGTHDLSAAAEQDLNAQLSHVAAWMASCLAAAAASAGGRKAVEPLRVSPQGTPVELVPDDEPGAIEFVVDRLVTGLRSVMDVMSTIFGPGDMGPQLQQLLGLVSTLLVLLIVHLAMRTNQMQQTQHARPPAYDGRYQDMGSMNDADSEGAEDRPSNPSNVRRREGMSNGTMPNAST